MTQKELGIIIDDAKARILQLEIENAELKASARLMDKVFSSMQATLEKLFEEERNRKYR